MEEVYSHYAVHKYAWCWGTVINIEDLRLRKTALLYSIMS